MYRIENLRELFQTGRGLLFRRPSGPRVGANVIFLGLTSLFTDISSEMVTTVLPIYLLATLRLTPFAFGLIDGIAVGAAALVRLAGGVLADQTRRYKRVAVAGYGLSLLSRIGLVLVGTSWGWVLGAVLIDRLGKGVRSDARDAMISFSASPTGLATAFGVHRALDTAGAMLGPLLAFGLLMMAPRAYDAVFVVSLCAALIGLAILIAFVESPPAAAEPALRPERPTAELLAGLLRRPDIRAIAVAAGVFNLATISDAFFYLILQRRADFHMGFFPLLYVATSGTYMLLALPMGILADRFGRTRVFIGGYLLLLLAYGQLLNADGTTAGVAAAVVLLGGYYAATEGVLMAIASGRLGESVRTSGMAVVMTAANLAKLLASLLFGWLWTWHGGEFAVGAFAAGLAGAIIVAWSILPPEGGTPAPDRDSGGS